MMHSIKDKLFHGEKHVDSDYDVIADKFALLQETCVKLKQNANNYVSSIYSVFLNSNNVSIDFATMLDDANTPNEYMALSQELRTSHNRLNSEKQQLIANDLTTKVITPIDEALKSYAHLQTRIVHRNELHTKLEYYLNKVHSLNKDRDERVAKGKVESTSHIDKFSRNQGKLNESRAAYASYASALMADLTNAWNGRIAVLGPAMASFVQAEKLFLQVFNQEIQEIKQTSKLTQIPRDVRSDLLDRRITSEDIPKPVVVGDLQSTKSQVIDTTALHAINDAAVITAPNVPSSTVPTVPNDVTMTSSSTSSLPSSAGVNATSVPGATVAPSSIGTTDAAKIANNQTTSLSSSTITPDVSSTADDIARADGEGMAQQIHTLTDDERRVNELNASKSIESNPFEEESFSASPPPPPPAVPTAIPTTTDLKPVDPLASKPLDLLDSSVDLKPLDIKPTVDSTTSSKLTGEEESKRQRWEQDEKMLA